MGAASEPKEMEFGDVKVTTTPLPYKVAEDYLPDVMLMVATVFGRLIELGGEGVMDNIDGEMDVKALIPVISPILQIAAAQLGGGMLKKLRKPLLSTTVVEASFNGEREVRSLVKDNEREEFFDEHPETYFPILIFSGMVTYKRFFPGSVLRNLLPKLEKGRKLKTVSS